MLTTKRLLKFLALFMAVALLVTACDRPFPSGEDDPPPTTEGYPVGEEEQAGEATAEPTRAVVEGEEGETPAETEEETGEVPGGEAPDGEVPAEETPGSEEPAGEESTDPGSGEEPAEGEGEPSDGEPGAEQPEAEAEATPAAEAEGEAEAPEATEEGGEPAPEGMEEEQTAEPETAEPETAEPESSGTSTQPVPATHTVAAGENLYRIGLQYGISWVSIARFNNISDPNRIFAGQVLRIPGGDTGGQPGPVPTPEGINYIVQYGDTLFKIGQRFGISWTEIAEANGLVNPNQIYAGQTLKIPVSAPTPPPVVHHVVQPGETLFRISLQYGVPWMAIAQANHISPPFYIFAGQTLVIPGGH